MIKLSNLKRAPGSVKNRKRVGRGTASGQGKTAGYLRASAWMIVSMLTFT